MQFADSYTLNGCRDPAFCGVFRRVDAHCVDHARGHCPSGRHARPGWTDATLCDAAPVYQRGADSYGPVLFRYWDSSDGSSVWGVGNSDVLADCDTVGHNFEYYSRYSDPSSGLPFSSPDAAIYGWGDHSGYGGLHIVAGDGGGGH